ncbi:hypothetical protein C8J32_101925 [Rhizobium sp. PP-CC-3A-592]|nr:hypothetical protein C8J32_101925 [Rhizobium sp. PP-CC-3A-592]
MRIELEARGWNVATIWECETKTDAELRQRLHEILSSVKPDGPFLEKH